MAAYREHISVSGLLGVAVGAAAHFLLGFTVTQAALAGWLTAVGGMLPDLDSQTGRPVREIFSIVASISPLLVVNRLLDMLGLPPTAESIMLLIVAMSLLIRYGGRFLIARVSVHRGMFHSIPALLIAAEVVFLCYPSDQPAVKFLMGSGIAIGFFSHLLLDEMYSFERRGLRVVVKKSAGSALKLAGSDPRANVLAYSFLALLTYATCVDVGLVSPKQTSGLLPPAIAGQESETATR